ncbi:MAG: radical SAM protein [Chloroflexi bacterium]|nr:radical SAM protein [Chloroflexota bacterium]
MPFEPAYLSLLASGEYAARVKSAYQRLAACDICPLRCGVNRLEGEIGVCQTALLAQVSSYGAHHGEEAPLSGWRGSGTIFFARCNLHCVFCQNADISQTGYGREMEPEALAALMLDLQDQGCHNINLVSPSHVVPQILAAVFVAAQAGLNLPLVYNTGGYDALETLRLLDGVIDIYMPDMKYADEQIALRYSRIPVYPAVNQAAVREMQRQVGDLQLDARGIATRGLLVRHLVLPNNLAGSAEIFRFLAEEISTNVYLNLMDQYHPAHLAAQHSQLNRRISAQEYRQACEWAKQAGLTRLDEPASRWY